MASEPTYDVPPQQYTAVVRQFISHEDDVTNQRIMWLLVVQGLLINAYVTVRNNEQAGDGVCLAGILVAASVFVTLYKSYQARGYLKFLGMLAKRGKLPEEFLRFDGWPNKRIKGWRRQVWFCPWLEKFSDVLEPYLSLPGLTAAAWLFLRINGKTSLHPVTATVLAFVLTALFLFGYCAFWVWMQDWKVEESIQDPG